MNIYFNNNLINSFIRFLKYFANILILFIYTKIINKIIIRYCKLRIKKGNYLEFRF